jgi:hypothetical protein
MNRTAEQVVKDAEKREHDLKVRAERNRQATMALYSKDGQQASKDAALSSLNAELEPLRVALAEGLGTEAASQINPIRTYDAIVDNATGVVFAFTDPEKALEGRNVASKFGLDLRWTSGVRGRAFLEYSAFGGIDPTAADFRDFVTAAPAPVEMPEQ